jgi:hypothetical protein
MKRTESIRKPLKMCLLLALVPSLLIGQPFTQRRSESFRNNWSININGGMTSYFGDLSLYDNNFSGKLRHESLPGGGIIAGKSIGHGAGLSGQLLYGRLKGRKTNRQMQSELVEYNVHLRINLVELFTGKSNQKFGVTGFAGIGHFMFKTSLVEVSEGGTKENIFRSRVPEFVTFMGGGFSCSINSKIDITSELSVRKFQNDKIDGVVEGHKYDYYSYMGFGITHKINTFRPRNEHHRDRETQSSLNNAPVYRPNLKYNHHLKR